MREYRVVRWVLITLMASVLGTAAAQEPESQIEHLIKAATHLEQAGYGQMAADVRQLAESIDPLLKHRLLESKRAQIAALQAELEQLQLALGPQDRGPKVVLRVKLLRLSMGKLRDFGLNLVSIRQLLDPDSPPSLLDDGGYILQFLKLLETQGFAEVVAEPTRVTTSGRPVYFRIGSSKSANPAAEVADPEKNGTAIRVPDVKRLECTPTITPGGQVILGVAILDAADPEHSKEPPSKVPASEPDRTEDKDDASSHLGAAGTRIEIAPDHTLIMALKSQSKAADLTVATLILVKAEVERP